MGDMDVGIPPATEPVRAAQARWWEYRGVGLPRSRRDLRFRHVAVVLLVAFSVWSHVDIGPRGRIITGQLGRHMTDFTVFPEAGAAFFDGRNPYEVTNPRGWHYLYPPLFAILIAPLSLFDTESQVRFWFTLNVALAFGCYFEGLRLWRLVAGEHSPLALWVGVCAGLATMLPALDCMQAGQLGIAILYSLLVGFRLLVEGRTPMRWFLGGVVLALPAVVKLVPAFPVVFLLYQRWSAVIGPGRGRRPWGQASALTGGVGVGVFLFLLAVPGAFVGWNKNLDHLRTWRARVVSNQDVAKTAKFNIHSYRNQSLTNAVYLWNEKMKPARPAGATEGAESRPGTIPDPTVRVAQTLILMLLACIGWTVGARRSRLDQATGFGLACLATLLLSPLSWGHYFMVELPAFLCVPLWIARRGLPRLARVVAAFPPACSWCYYLAQQPAGLFGILGLGTTAWFLAICTTILACEVGRTIQARSSASGKSRTAAWLPRPHFRARVRRIPQRAESRR